MPSSSNHGRVLFLFRRIGTHLKNTAHLRARDPDGPNADHASQDALPHHSPDCLAVELQQSGGLGNGKDRWKAHRLGLQVPITDTEVRSMMLQKVDVDTTEVDHAA